MNIPQARAPRAFTLLELLVAIGIICILAAFILPGIESAREQANRTKCCANLRQCGVALFLYAGEHSQQLPSTGGDASYPDSFGVSYATSLVTSLNGYLPDFRVWTCPSVNAVPIDSPANTPPLRCSYQYFPFHAQLSGTTASALLINNGRMSDQTADRILMQDESYWYPGAGAWRTNHSVGGILKIGLANSPSLKTFFGGTPAGMNILFGDGSVKWQVYRTNMQGLRWLNPTSDTQVPTAMNVALATP